jgi:hypothetical protein
MRFVFTADKILLKQLSELQDTQQVEGEETSKSELVIDAVQMLYQIDTLLAEGYQFAIIDPKGNKHFLKRGKTNDEDDVQ